MANLAKTLRNTAASAAFGLVGAAAFAQSSFTPTGTDGKPTGPTVSLSTGRVNVIEAGSSQPMMPEQPVNNPFASGKLEVVVHQNGVLDTDRPVHAVINVTGPGQAPAVQYAPAQSADFAALHFENGVNRKNWQAGHNYLSNDNKYWRWYGADEAVALKRNGNPVIVDAKTKKVLGTEFDSCTTACKRYGAEWEARKGEHTQVAGHGSVEGVWVVVQPPAPEAKIAREEVKTPAPVMAAAPAPETIVREVHDHETVIYMNSYHTPGEWDLTKKFAHLVRTGATPGAHWRSPIKKEIGIGATLIPYAAPCPWVIAGNVSAIFQWPRERNAQTPEQQEYMAEFKLHLKGDYSDDVLNSTFYIMSKQLDAEAKLIMKDRKKGLIVSADEEELRYAKSLYTLAHDPETDPQVREIIKQIIFSEVNEWNSSWVESLRNTPVTPLPDDLQYLASYDPTQPQLDAPVASNEGASGAPPVPRAAATQGKSNQFANDQVPNPDQSSRHKLPFNENGFLGTDRQAEDEARDAAAKRNAIKPQSFLNQMPSMNNRGADGFYDRKGGQGSQRGAYTLV